jgi:hypothetical protein
MDTQPISLSSDRLTLTVDPATLALGLAYKGRQLLGTRETAIGGALPNRPLAILRAPSTRPLGDELIALESVHWAIGHEQVKRETVLRATLPYVAHPRLNELGLGPGEFAITFSLWNHRTVTVAVDWTRPRGLPFALGFAWPLCIETTADEPWIVELPAHRALVSPVDESIITTRNGRPSIRARDNAIDIRLEPSGLPFLAWRLPHRHRVVATPISGTRPPNARQGSIVSFSIFVDKPVPTA